MPLINHKQTKVKNKMSRAKGTWSPIEALAILLVLVIIAGIAGPRLVFASSAWRNTKLKSQLTLLRAGVEQYHRDHKGKGPHLDEQGQIDPDSFIRRMTSSTFSNGKISKLGECGPYLLKWPANPFAESSISKTIALGWSTIPPRDGTTGWYYSIHTGVISPNSPEGAMSLDPAGVPLPMGTTAAKSILNPNQMLIMGFRLTAIMEGPEGKVAIVNGLPMRIGETILGAKITEIGRYHVELESEGRHITIGMAIPIDLLGVATSE